VTAQNNGDACCQNIGGGLRPNKTIGKAKRIMADPTGAVSMSSIPVYFFILYP
jgi:hypothetical protein